MARTQQEYRTIPRSQQVRQRKEQQFEGIEEYDYAVTLEQAGGSMKQRGETCRLRPRPRIGKATIGRQEAGIPGIPGCSLGIDHEPGIRVDAIVRVHFTHHQAWMAPVHFGTSTRPTFLRACSKAGTETGFDRARELLQRLKKSHMPMGTPGQVRRSGVSESQAKPCKTCRSDLIIGKNRSRIGKRRYTFVDGNRCWSPRVSRAERRSAVE